MEEEVGVERGRGVGVGTRATARQGRRGSGDGEAGEVLAEGVSGAEEGAHTGSNGNGEWGRKEGGPRLY